jgi:hypothetical protein
LSTFDALIGFSLWRGVVEWFVGVDTIILWTLFLNISFKIIEILKNLSLDVTKLKALLAPMA